MSCKRPKFPIDQDPDYEDIIAHQNKRIKWLEKDANDKSIKTIQQIVKTQFAHSIAEKEIEIDTVDKRLDQARMMLDRLRAYIVTGYFSAPDKLTNDSGRNAPTSVHPAIKKILRGKRPAASIENLKVEKIETKAKSVEELTSVNLTKTSSLIKQELKTETEASVCIKTPQSSSISADAGRGSRFKVTKKIIVGNTSKYIPVDKREPNDNLKYKWMVYVCTPDAEENIGSFVKKVSFVLHPTFGSNNVVEVCKPPFKLIRRGWGEFPIRVQIDFHDPRNKSRTIIHTLTFDRTFTGFETRGSETIAEFHIYKPEECCKTNGKTISLTQESAKLGSSIEENDIGVNVSDLITKEEEKEDCALISETIVSKVEGEKETIVTKENFNSELSPPKNQGSDNLTVTNNESIVTQNENIIINTTNEKRTTIKPQITVFPTKSTLLTSPKSLSDKIVVLSPIVEKKNSGSLSLFATRQEKVIASPSASLIRPNDSAMSKRWTSGVSLLQKTKSKITANNQQDTRRNSNTLIILPNANNRQEKIILGPSVDKMLSMSVQNAVINNSNSNTAATLLILPTAEKTNNYNSDETKQGLKTLTIPSIKEQTIAGNNGGPYVRCSINNGERLMLPESLLKKPLILPKTTAVEAKSSSLQKYHLQVIPTTGSKSQAQFVPLNSLKNLVPSTVVKTNVIKSLTQAQNVKLGKNLNITSALAQMNYASGSSGCFVSSSACPPTQKQFSFEIENFDDMIDVMKCFVKYHPIVSKCYEKTQYPYCASSVDAFLSWNIGRQRAAEWQRAKAVQKLIKECFSESSKWKDKEVWSTKKIYWWCRRWGFSPMKTESENSTEEVVSTVSLKYSEASELCTQLHEHQKTVGIDNGDNEDADVDIMSMDDSSATSVTSASPIKQKVVDRINFPQTPELEFVQDAVSKIGVKLKPVEAYPGVLANVVDEMLLTACKCFLENITRRSLVQAFKRLGDKKCPGTLIWDDVYHCIETVPEFDFLTNQFLGKNIQVDSQLTPSTDAKEK